MKACLNKNVFSLRLKVVREQDSTKQPLSVPYFGRLTTRYDIFRPICAQKLTNSQLLLPDRTNNQKKSNEDK